MNNVVYDIKIIFRNKKEEETKFQKLYEAFKENDKEFQTEANKVLSVYERKEQKEIAPKKED